MEDNLNTPKGFVLFKDYISVVNMLSDEMAGKLFKIILEYANGNEIEITDFTLKLVFEPIKNELNRGLEKYAKVCERNKSNIAKRYSKPKKSDISTTGNQSLPTTTKSTTGKNGIPNLPVATKSTNTSTDTSTDTSTIVVETTGENYNNSDVAISFLQSCLLDEIYLRSVSKENKIEIEKIKLALQNFENHQISIGKVSEDLSDFKKHFINWLRKMQEKNIKTTNSKIQL
jgi:hypothetical protein